MTLFELQAWLGHRSPQSTQFYAKITPATLTRAYDDTGYFSRNVRTIEVLIDRDAVASGAWPVTGFGHLTGDRLRCPGTLSSVHSRRDETHVQ